MKIMLKIALLTGALALAGGGAAVAGDQMPVYGEPPQGEPPHGPKAGLPPQAKAYGRHCKGESKKHVKGEKGTEFSRCVKDVVELRRQKREEEAAAAV